MVGFWKDPFSKRPLFPNPSNSQRAVRDILMPRGKLTLHCLAAIFDSQLPSPKLSLKMPLKLPLPHNRGHFLLFQNCPCGEGNCAAIEQQKLSRGNFCLAASRCLPGPSGLRSELPGPRTKNKRSWIWLQNGTFENTWPLAWPHIWKGQRGTPGKGIGRNTLKTPWNCPETALKTPWKYPENTLKIPWNSWLSISYPCPLWVCPLHLSNICRAPIQGVNSLWRTKFARAVAQYHCEAPAKKFLSWWEGQQIATDSKSLPSDHAALQLKFPQHIKIVILREAIPEAFGDGFSDL